MTMSSDLPCMELANKVYLSHTSPAMYAHYRTQILDKIAKDQMAVFYKHVCQLLSWSVDQELLNRLEKENEIETARLTALIETAETDLGESEVREAYLQRAHYFCKTGQKEKAVEAYTETLSKTISMGQKIEIVLTLVRLGFFYHDTPLLRENLGLARKYIEKAGEWDKRNHLKVYEGLCKQYTRDFSGAADLFASTLSTFATTDIVTYPTFVTYTAISALLAFDRVRLVKQITKTPEFFALSADLGPENVAMAYNGYAQRFNANRVITQLVTSFCELKYADFFQALVKLDLILSHDYYLSRHHKLIVRRLRIKAYNQLLQSYSSVTLGFMADAFGVTEEFIDDELSELIASDKVHCKIDRVAGVINTNIEDQVAKQHHQTLKHGDILQEKIGRLFRLVNTV